MFDESDIVFRYTSDEAEEDGILFDITRLKPEWKNGMFNYVTTNLLSKGYMEIVPDVFGDYKDLEFNMPALLGLLNQALNIVRSKSNNFKDADWFFSGKIELQDGTHQEIFIAQNETGRMTLMLPEDY